MKLGETCKRIIELSGSREVRNIGWKTWLRILDLEFIEARRLTWKGDHIYLHKEVWILAYRDENA